MRGVVKVFKQRRGYGFIARGDGSDVFVFIEDVKLAGRDRLYPAEELEFQIGRGEGNRSCAVHLILSDPAPQEASERGRIEGTVCWFDAGKGRGFINTTDGKGDVFVLMAALDQSGVGLVDKGERLSFVPITYTDGRKREAICLRRA